MLRVDNLGKTICKGCGSMRCYGLTDVGKVREINEDSFAVKIISDEIVVAVVADGMGGHKAGEEASSYAANEMVNLVTEASKFFCGYTDEQIAGVLKNAINKINKKIYTMSSEIKKMSGMGTTIVVCVVYNNRCYVANVGDSRLYKYSGELEQVTKDHSYVSELVRMGVITREQARNHPNKNVITKAVGTEKNVVPDIFNKKIDSGDIILLCSDGLTNMVTDDVISKIICDKEDIEASCAKLVEIAKDNGGTDNITVVLLEVEREGDDSL